MQKKFDIAVIGDVNPDLILTGKDIIPEFGQVEKWIDDAELTIGGSAGIFAVGAAKLGLKVTFIGKVGDDHFGHFMKDRMTAQGIETRVVIRKLFERIAVSVGFIGKEILEVRKTGIHRIASEAEDAGLGNGPRYRPGMDEAVLLADRWARHHRDLDRPAAGEGR